jgi:hypothetical protein
MDGQSIGGQQESSMPFEEMRCVLSYPIAQRQCVLPECVQQQAISFSGRLCGRKIPVLREKHHGAAIWTRGMSVLFKRGRILSPLEILKEQKTKTPLFGKQAKYSYI